jgi:hypothetical protein
MIRDLFVVGGNQILMILEKSGSHMQRAAITAPIMQTFTFACAGIVKAHKSWLGEEVALRTPTSSSAPV